MRATNALPLFAGLAVALAGLAVLPVASAEPDPAYCVIGYVVCYCVSDLGQECHDRYGDDCSAAVGLGPEKEGLSCESNGEPLPYPPGICVIGRFMCVCASALETCYDGAGRQCEAAAGPFPAWKVGVGCS